MAAVERQEISYLLKTSPAYKLSSWYYVSIEIRSYYSSYVEFYATPDVNNAI